MTMIFLRNKVSGAAAFTPASLFASGEEGAWYEPSTTTAFLSTTDLTPCGVGDSCGFLLDKSQGAGYSGGSFTGLGSELVTNGTFDTDTSGWTATADATVTWEAGRLQVASVSTASAYQALSVTAGKAILLSGTVEATTSTSGSNIALRSGVSASTGFIAGIDPQEGIGSTTGSIVYVPSTTGTIYLHLRNFGAATALFDNISVRELPGNHATQGTAAARPTLQQTAGGLWYLDLDGVDDGLATASIDFTSTDKMSVFAAVEKDTETTSAVYLELSANWLSNSGSFSIVTDTSSGANDYTSGSRGNALYNTNQVARSDDTANQKSVVTALHDISGDSSILRIDGTQVDEATGDKGAGNFGNYPLNIGARDVAGTASVFFDGRIYGLIVRGATSTAGEISDTESYLAAKSGVTL